MLSSFNSTELLTLNFVGYIFPTMPLDTDIKIFHDFGPWRHYWLKLKPYSI